MSWSCEWSSSSSSPSSSSIIIIIVIVNVDTSPIIIGTITDVVLVSFAIFFHSDISSEGNMLLLQLLQLLLLVLLLLLLLLLLPSPRCRTGLHP